MGSRLRLFVIAANRTDCSVRQVLLTVVPPLQPETGVVERSTGLSRDRSRPRVIEGLWRLSAKATPAERASRQTPRASEEGEFSSEHSFCCHRSAPFAESPNSQSSSSFRSLPICNLLENSPSPQNRSGETYSASVNPSASQYSSRQVNSNVSTLKCNVRYWH